MNTETSHKLEGVVCAATTPFEDGQLNIENHQRHIKALDDEGCDGVLLMGTTGEGASIGLAEREDIINVAMDVSGDMTVMVGTGCSSLKDTIIATRQAFDLGADAVVVVPPFYFKNVTVEGLFSYYSQLFDEAVPDGKSLLAYHIPQVSSVPITFDLLERLLKVAGDRMAGIKDSSGNLDNSLELCRRFPELRVFVGTDKFLLEGLKAGAAGCITAGANVLAPLAVDTYKAFVAGKNAAKEQELLSAARTILEQYPPFPPSMKSLLAYRYGTSGWDVRPPLDPLPSSKQQHIIQALAELDLPEHYQWLESSRLMADDSSQ